MRTSGTTDFGAVADWQLAAPAVVTGNGTNWVACGLAHFGNSIVESRPSLDVKTVRL